MSNNLKRLAKELRRYAKRCKDIKYTDSLLLTFLITGMFTLASSVNSADKKIEEQNAQIAEQNKQGSRRNLEFFKTHAQIPLSAHAECRRPPSTANAPTGQPASMASSLNISAVCGWQVKNRI